MTRSLVRAAVRTALLLACATAAPLAATRAQAATASQPAATVPNLAGTWELNAAASDFGPQGGATKATLVVTQAADKIIIHATQSTPVGEQSTTVHYAIGGAPVTDSVSAAGQIAAMTSTTRWEGATLVNDGKVAMRGMEIPVVSRYTLSADGRTMTINRMITTPVGAMPIRLVYDRKG